METPSDQTPTAAPRPSRADQRRKPGGARISVALAAILTWLAAAPGTAAQTPVDVELMLAVDVSYSMTDEELEIQRRGYAAALRDPAIWQAIQTGRLQRIALIYVEWAGTARRRIVAPWSLIESEADLEAVATTLDERRSAPMLRTSLSNVLDAAPTSFETNAFVASRRVIDISGDGPNNQGRPVTEARDALIAAGYTINGLPLVTRKSRGFLPELDDLDLYYERCVIGGPLAFSIPVRSWREFFPAVRQKLVLEIAGVAPPPPEPRIIRAQWRGATEAGYDCLIGEKMWNRYIVDEPK